MRNNFTTGVLVSAIVALVAIAGAVVMVIGGASAAPVVAMIAPLSIGFMNMVRLEQNAKGMDLLTNGFIPDVVKEALSSPEHVETVKNAVIEARTENGDS